MQPIPDEARALAVTEGEAVQQRPSKTQIGWIRGHEKALGWPRRWAANRAEATAYLNYLRIERRKAAAVEKREKDGDPMALPATETQLFQLRQAGVTFELPLTRREAFDLLGRERKAA